MKSENKDARVSLNFNKKMLNKKFDKKKLRIDIGVYL